jgi:signal transduction histidine kinase
MEARAVDIASEVVRPVVKDLLPLVEGRGMRVENHMPDSLMVEGDVDLLRIVYKNLLDNAAKYGSSGGVIRLGCTRETDVYTFEVWNEGQGLPPEKLERLFGKFVRLHRESDTVRSTGLGLFITKNIIEMHWGEIWADSQEGEGISFFFTLPVPLSAEGF